MRNNSDTIISVAVFGTIAVVVVACYLIANYRNRKRVEALRSVAEGLGLGFEAQGGLDVVVDRGWCPLFSSGRSMKVLNLMRGAADGRELAVFDYQFVTGHGKSTRTVRTTVVCLRFDGPDLPGFTLRPEGLWDKIGGWF